MPGPSRTCAFGASSKAAHYSFKISLLLKIFLTALSKNPRSVLVISKVAFGKNPFNRIKLQTENDLLSLHLHQALRTIIQPEKGKQKYCLCCPVYLKGLKLELKVKAQQYFEGSFTCLKTKKRTDVSLLHGIKSLRQVICVACQLCRWFVYTLTKMFLLGRKQTN